MNINDPPKIDELSHTGISVCLVTKLSKKAAIKNNGTSPIAIFIPSTAPFLNEAIRV